MQNAIGKKCGLKFSDIYSKHLLKDFVLSITYFEQHSTESVLSIIIGDFLMVNSIIT